MLLSISAVPVFQRKTSAAFHAANKSGADEEGFRLGFSEAAAVCLALREIKRSQSTQGSVQIPLPVTLASFSSSNSRA